MGKAKAQTYNPKKKKRKRKYGFLKRMSSKTGQQTIKRRRAKGRKKLTV
ncbi:MAG: 50S ribosomal protein L34 [Candidatus Spechtbacterales bacterium]